MATWSSVMVDLHVLAKPRARQDRVEVETLDGVRMVIVHVKAPPDKNKANTAIIKLLARTIGVPQSAISIVRGHASHEKLVRVDGTGPDELDGALAALDPDG